MSGEYLPAESLRRRQAGVLLHITSLPSRSLCGNLGPEARNFVDFLAAAGMGVWQMLPVGPVGLGGSPYQTQSSHAGDFRLISLVDIVHQGWLESSRLDEAAIQESGQQLALRLAWESFQLRAADRDRQALAQFGVDSRYWLDDYALYAALRRERGVPWWEWPSPLRDRQPQALAAAAERLAAEIATVRFEQFLFFSQWQALKSYANQRGVLLFGDLPIFVAHDSADVWASPQDFDLKSDGQPRVVAGVPPDYFSATGQRWGNPLYRWERMAAQGFPFWIDRMRTQLKLFDLVRIDHFRGFEAYWEIPAEEPDAVRGQWVKAGGDALFQRLHQVFGPLPLVAEDLGIITPEVERLRKDHGLPGMKVLQFAFSGGPSNPYLPYHQGLDGVVYTGTHDNDTSLGWYLSLDSGTRALVDDYLGHSREPMPWPLIRCALGSRANLAIIPMQDLLGLDGDHRMNLPGTVEGNWHWGFQWSQVEPDLAERVRHLVRLYGR